MELRLKFVCAANVCRSPLMALTFSEALARDEVGGTWKISSGGAMVKDPLPLCEVASGILLAQKVVDRIAIDEHRARRLQPADLERQDLIITASKEERSAVARLRPQLRSRTFTLKEAVSLARAPIGLEQWESVAAAAEPEASPVARYATLLHLRRGTLPAESPSRAEKWRRPVGDPQDIPDVHLARRRVHLSTLKDARESTLTLHSQLASFLRLGAVPST